MRKTTKLTDERDMHIPDTSHNEMSADDRELMRTLVFRRWPPFLSGSEKAIVNFVYDRTVHYNRWWAYVSLETLYHGYPYKDDRMSIKTIWCGDLKLLRGLTVMERARFDEGEMFLTAPTGLGRRQIVTALGSLLDRGFIRRGGTKQEPELALNPDAYYNYSDIHPGKKQRKRK